MTRDAQVEYHHLQVDIIKGGVFLDRLSHLDEKTPQLVRELRKLAETFRKDGGWRSPLSVERGSALESDKLKELADQGPEAAALLAALASAREKSAKESPQITLRGDDPKFIFRVAADGIEFQFDDVQDRASTRKTLEQCLKTSLDTLELPEIKKFGMNFRTIFRLRQGQTNFGLLGDTLLPGLAEPKGVYKSFGKDIDIRRADLAWVFYRKDGELITHVELEAPGNDRNTTIWLNVDTQTAGEILNSEELQDLQDYFQYHEEVVTAFLKDVFAGDSLDTTRRDMMTDQWFHEES